jgi:prostaglandin-endoperoxide synthase 2
MVGIDALSQALTNPLLAERIYGPKTFSDVGMTIINETRSLNDIVERNVRDEPERGVSKKAVSEVSFTNARWQRE